VKRDTGLDNLLDMDGFKHIYECAYWWKITAYRVKASNHIPHGIRYNLTFPDSHGTRIFGIDNTHIPPNRRKGFHGRIVEYDHTHEDQNDKGTAYSFVSAEKLLDDFYTRIEGIIENLK